MTLTCGPPDTDLGQISASEWTFNGWKIENGKRFDITSGRIYTLTVNNVILADIGTAVNPMAFTFLDLHFERAHHWLVSLDRRALRMHSERPGN